MENVPSSGELWPGVWWNAPETSPVTTTQMLSRAGWCALGFEGRLLRRPLPL